MPEVDEKDIERIQNLREQLRQQVVAGKTPNQKLVAELTKLVEKHHYADELGEDID